MNFDIGSLLFDRFIILSRLGEGSYGNVFKALDTSDRTLVALKVSEGNDEIKKRNVEEAKILKYLNGVRSPYGQLVISMKTYMVLDKYVVLVLELMPQSLSQVVKRNTDGASYLAVAKYAVQMFNFLCFMSKMNVIHADIKSHNILLDWTGCCLKFVDFGLAYCPNVSTKSHYIQSLFYRSPEVVLGYDYDASVDVWSTGCVLVQCLIGKHLFRVKDEMELIRSITLALGTPDQRLIRDAPKRNDYFFYDYNLKVWIPKGYQLPVVPLGLRSYLKIHHNRDVDCSRGIAFLDLVERMLRLEPYNRMTPEECVGHYFLREMNVGRHSEVIFGKREKKMKVATSGFDEATGGPIGVAIRNQNVSRHLQQFPAHDVHSKARENVDPTTGVNVAAAAAAGNNKENIENMDDSTSRYDLVKISDHHGKEEKMDENETEKAIEECPGECEKNLDIEEHVAVYCSKLCLPASVAARAKEIYGRAVEGRVFVRSQPRTVVPACIYAAAKEAGVKRSFAALGRVMCVLDSSIKYRFNLLKRRSGLDL